MIDTLDTQNPLTNHQQRFWKMIGNIENDIAAVIKNIKNQKEDSMEDNVFSFEHDNAIMETTHQLNTEEIGMIVSHIINEIDNRRTLHYSIITIFLRDAIIAYPSLKKVIIENENIQLQLQKIIRITFMGDAYSISKFKPNGIYQIMIKNVSDINDKDTQTITNSYCQDVVHLLQSPVFSEETKEFCYEMAMDGLATLLNESNEIIGHHETVIKAVVNTINNCKKGDLGFEIGRKIFFKPQLTPLIANDEEQKKWENDEGQRNIIIECFLNELYQQHSTPGYGKIMATDNIGMYMERYSCIKEQIIKYEAYAQHKISGTGSEVIKDITDQEFERFVFMVTGKIEDIVLHRQNEYNTLKTYFPNTISYIGEEKIQKIIANRFTSLIHEAHNSSITEKIAIVSKGALSQSQKEQCIYQAIHYQRKHIGFFNLNAFVKSIKEMLAFFPDTNFDKVFHNSEIQQYIKKFIEAIENETDKKRLQQLIGEDEYSKDIHNITIKGYIHNTLSREKKRDMREAVSTYYDYTTEEKADLELITLKNFDHQRWKYFNHFTQIIPLHFKESDKDTIKELLYQYILGILLPNFHLNINTETMKMLGTFGITTDELEVKIWELFLQRMRTLFLSKHADKRTKEESELFRDSLHKMRLTTPIYDGDIVTTKALKKGFQKGFKDFQMDPVYKYNFERTLKYLYRDGC